MNSLLKVKKEQRVNVVTGHVYDSIGFDPLCIFLKTQPVTRTAPLSKHEQNWAQFNCQSNLKKC